MLAIRATRRCLARGALCRGLQPALVVAGDGASGPDGSFIAPVILRSVGRDPARESFPPANSGVGILVLFCVWRRQMNFSGQPIWYDSIFRIC